MLLDLTAEDKYYYWLMTSIGLDEELVGYIRDCVESDEEVSELILELYNEIQNRNALKRILYLSVRPPHIIKHIIYGEEECSRIRRNRFIRNTYSCPHEEMWIPGIRRRSS